MDNWEKICLGASVVAIALSVIGAFAGDIWLAPTQWMLIAATLGIYAVYLKK